MFAEILVSDKKALDKLILSAIDCQDDIIKKLRFMLEIIPNKGVYIIADSNETDQIPLKDLALMLTSCGTEILKKRSIHGSVQIHNRKRYVLKF